MKEKLLSIIFSILLSVCLLSVSIALPILIRNFYYIQIDYFNLPEKTGYSAETIRKAYDEILDYCTRGGENAGLTFSCGELAWSESGKEHFDDVEQLFHMVFMIAIFSITLLACFSIISLILYFHNGRGVPFYHFVKRGPLFWGPAVMLGLFGILGIIAALDFDAFFTAFHNVFFSGNDTWLLDKKTDEIIRILPDEVFRSFGIIILLFLLAGCAGCIAADIIIRRTIRKNR